MQIHGRERAEGAEVRVGGKGIKDLLVMLYYKHVGREENRANLG